MIATQHDPMTTVFNDNICVALLGMAETLRLSNPPSIRLAIKCLKAMFNLPIPISIQMTTVAHFHLGKFLHEYTDNIDEARTNLEIAYRYAQTMPGFDEIRVHSASRLADVYLKANRSDMCKNLLRQQLESSPNFPFWHCRILFQLADVYAKSRDSYTACTLLEAGAEFCMNSNVFFTEALFRLARGILIVLDPERRGELREIVERVHSLITVIPGCSTRRDELKAFCLVVQVCYFLSSGAMKSAKPCLKQLQSTVQQLTGPRNTPENAADSLIPLHCLELFHWLPKEHITVVVYLLTVNQALQSGQVERMQKYAERGLVQVDKLRQYFGPCSDFHLDLLLSLQVLLFEHSVLGRLVIGQPSIAIKEISTMVSLVGQHPLLFDSHEAQCHTLLGLYAMSIRCPNEAEKQFNTALRTVKDRDLWTFVNLNLAIVYLQAGRDQDFYELLERITPERLQSSSQTLLAASHYVRGLQSFCQSRNQEAKRYLKDCLAISNKEEIMRVSAMALVLLGHIFLRSSVQECSNMLGPAVELANKIPDISLQAWATSLLKDVYLMCGEVKKANDSKYVSETYTDRLDLDRRKARESSVHTLIQWTEGPPAQL